MFKKLLATTAMLFAITSFAAVDANKGTVAELDGCLLYTSRCV